ncbi:hypothetical protein Ppa06_70030 [Planomonospora parontospora subsp. parontospora]|uniref:Uncharacterized protein n=2 Tax=Planomonospora parontospora TaxID=58119 RepID=A0AA37BMS3_9ACTN|nr:hypothetical protein [Planomonospora parontospora]GGK94016.1 hypothetical protein GCM10010126_61750 [Planomonospora parontospora]GII13205.1 hypothetical protein Ppa06_70030 [Planomonospora parontospora subsp. parontospora]
MTLPAPSAKAQALVRDIRQLFARVGIPEKGNGPAGGYHVWAEGQRASLMWWAEAKFDEQSGERGVDHPDHPVVRVERATTLAMERAMADVLYAAGFTVVLVPGVPSRDPEKERDPKLRVIAAPEFKAWTSD